MVGLCVGGYICCSLGTRRFLFSSFFFFLFGVLLCLVRVVGIGFVNTSASKQMKPPDPPSDAVYSNQAVFGDKYQQYDKYSFIY